jgi:hypothetical protein
MLIFCVTFKNDIPLIIHVLGNKKTYVSIQSTFEHLLYNMVDYIQHYGHHMVICSTWSKKKKKKKKKTLYSDPNSDRLWDTT